MIWVIFGICICISFLFSGIEAGILSVNRVRLRNRVNLEDKAAIKLDRLLAHPERLLVTVLIVTNLMNIFAIVLVTRELVKYLGPVGYPLALGVCLPLYLLGLEVLPKSLFRRFPYRALAALSEPLRIADLVLSPILGVGHWIAKILLPKEGAEPQKLFSAREDFKYLTVESEKVGTLSNIERQMIHNVVDFRSITARQIMVPLASVVHVKPDAFVTEALELSRKKDLDRLPVMNEKGQLIGIVNVLEMLLDRGDHDRVDGYLRRMVMVGPNESAYTVMQKLRAARNTIAAVLDGNSQPIGIVSWEDLIKKFVNLAAA